VPARVLPWRLLVPAKEAGTAKSRLEHPARPALVRAMTADVLGAARTVVGAAHVVAVTDRGRGLDGDVLAAAAALDDPHAPVAVLMGDLPAVRPDELRAALVAAAGHERAVLSDASGTGTALLTARDATLLSPAYGPGSLGRHVAAGAVELSELAAPGLRRDVDTADELEEAVRLGVGPATASVLGVAHGATVASFDAASASGTALTDAGERIALPPGPVAAAGLRLLRPGQRLATWVRDGAALAVRIGPPDARR
jgi:2-phospho-L-lactate guanylyltransferase